VYTLRRSAIWLRSLYCTDLAGISTEFSGAGAITKFYFIYTLDGVTVMPRGLHAI